MLVGAQFAFPGAVAAGVGADRPEMGAAAEKAAVAQDQNAAVAPSHAVEHMHVDGIKPVLHGPKDIAGGGRCRASRGVSCEPTHETVLKHNNGRRRLNAPRGGCV